MLQNFVVFSFIALSLYALGRLATKRQSIVSFGIFLKKKEVFK